MRFTLVPSPLLGPVTWAGTAAALRELGHEASVSAYDDLPAEPGVLVPHSNAGYWTAGRGPTVFVDAALPAVGATSTTLAPPAFHDFLAGLADDDGLLPPWTQWWDDVGGSGDLFPSAAVEEAVTVEQPRLPLSWFEQLVAVPTGWVESPAAYLAFGDTYAEETALARDRSWPVTVLEGGHLQMLHDPAGVATVVSALAASLRP